MAVAKGVWGIDIGQCALKAIRLQMIDGKPTATAFDYIEHAKILSQPDADPDALIREALEKFLSRNEVKLDEVALGIAGQSGLARFVKLPPVEEKKIAEIVKFEAKQQIPFPLDEVVWDFQKIAGGEAVDGFALETEIGLFAMKRDVISRYLGYFSGTKVEIHTVQMSPLALVNFATYEILKKGGLEGDAAAAEATPDDTPRGKKRCAVVMDIGTEASNLIITDGGKVIWQRPIPLGGNNFTRALTKELKLTFAKAEHLKRNAAKSPEMASILRAIKPVLTDFVGEVQRSLGYFTNTHRDAHVAYMVGLGSAFKLPGLQKYLSDKLSLEVRKPAKFERLEGESILADPLLQENLLTFPVAYGLALQGLGLALQGLGLARLGTNLLPAEIRTDRLIRSKKPYAVAAAAMLLIGTAGLAIGYGKTLQSVSDPQIKQAQEQAQSAASAYDSQEGKFSSAKSGFETTVSDVKQVLAGNDERLNWPRFLEVQTGALPFPGKEGNLIKKNPPQVNYWQGSTKGMQALQWFERRMAQGVAIENAKDELPDPKEPDKHDLVHLPMVNIEAVRTRWIYGDQVGEFLKAVDTAVFTGSPQALGSVQNIADFMKENEREKAEDQGGRYVPVWTPVEGEPGVWAVEIRGYTYHHTGVQFLKDCLVENLRNFDEFASKGEVLIRDEKGVLKRVKADSKVKEYVVGVEEDPVKGRVSHAFLFGWKQVENAQLNTVTYVNRSYLDQFFAGGTAGGGNLGGYPGGSPTGGPPSAPGTGLGGGDPDERGGYGGTGAAAPTAGAFGPAWTGLTGGATGGLGGLGGPGIGGIGGAGIGGPPGAGGVGIGGGTPTKEEDRVVASHQPVAGISVVTSSS